MTQYLTKRNIIIAVIAVILLAVIVIAVVMQLGSEMPTLIFDCGELDQKETGMFYEAIPIDWRGGTKEQKEMAKIAKTEGYVTAMQGQAGCVMYSGRNVDFSFEDAAPEHVTLNVYDEYGVLLESTPLDTTYRFMLPQELGSKLYVLEAIFEEGTCAYAFWVMTM